MPRHWVCFLGLALICVGSLADQASFEEEFDLIENEMDRDFVEQAMARTRERCIRLQADCLRESNPAKCRDTVREAPGCDVLFTTEEAETGNRAAVEAGTFQPVPRPGAPQQAVSPPLTSQSVASGARPIAAKQDWEEGTDEDAEEDWEEGTDEDAEEGTQVSQHTDSITPGEKSLSVSNTPSAPSPEAAGGIDSSGASRQAALPAPDLMESADPSETAIPASSRAPASQDASLDEP